MDRDAYSIGEFCQRHGFSRASYYNLKAKNQAPREMHVGKLVRITEEAAADWRREREAEAHAVKPPKAAA